MNKHIDLGLIALKVLEKSPYTFTKLDIGEYAALKSKGVKFNIEVYDIDGIGRLSIMHMKTVLNFLRMESVVFTVKNKDVPLLNTDWIRVLGKEVMINELYDVSLSPYPESSLNEYQAISDRDADMENYVSDEQSHWYDDILYPCSYHKMTKKEYLRLSDASIDYIKTFVRQFSEAPECDENEKQKNIRNYAEALYAANGPAVDAIKKSFGEEKARKIIVDLLYGC